MQTSNMGSAVVALLHAPKEVPLHNGEAWRGDAAQLRGESAGEACVGQVPGAEEREERGEQEGRKERERGMECEKENEVV